MVRFNILKGIQIIFCEIKIQIKREHLLILQIKVIVFSLFVCVSVCVCFRVSALE